MPRPHGDEAVAAGTRQARPRGATLLLVVIVVICAALVLAGWAAGVAWAGRRFESPPAEVPLGAGEVARRYVWYVSLALLAGVLAGTTIIGAGGRLAMRMLAVTGGADAQGRLTEADEVVGEISAGGTLAFVLFTGLIGGCGAALVYLLVRRLLPGGALGGAIFGLLLLVVFGTRVDPLRRDNPDFDIVGPGWLAVAVFSLLAVAFGVALVGITARLSAWLPLPAARGPVLVRYAGPAVVAAAGVSVTALLALVGGAVVGVTRWPRLVAAVRSPRAVLVGRAVLVVLALVALPGTLVALADIVRR